MFTVYVLYSNQFDKIYIGYTSDLQSRLLSHNVISKNTYTSKYRPWTVIYAEKHATKKEAMVREKQLKTATGRKYLRQRIEEKNKSTI